MTFFNNNLQIYFWKNRTRMIQINKYENGNAEGYFAFYRLHITWYWKHKSDQRFHKTIKF